MNRCVYIHVGEEEGRQTGVLSQRCVPWLTVPFWSTAKLSFHHVFSDTALNKAQALPGVAVPAEHQV